MHLRLGFDLHFELPCPVAIIALLHVHPFLDASLLKPDRLQTEPGLEVPQYIDSFGNRCSRLYAPAGPLRLFNTTEIVIPDFEDQLGIDAPEVPVQDLPDYVLQFLLNSRYCEVDRLSAVALDMFGMVAGAGGDRLCVSHRAVWLQLRALDQDRARCVYRTHRGLPRLSALGDYAVSGA
jgi:hypothetical protein